MSGVTGGNKLGAFFANFERNLEAGYVKVGFLGGQSAGKKADKDAAELAFYNEFGTIGRATLGSFKSTYRIGAKKGQKKKNMTKPYHIPARPFFRTMVDAEHSKWGKALARYLKTRGYDVKVALGLLGLMMLEQLQYSIAKWTTPPNADITAKRKGFNKPLEDSGRMKRSANYKVEEGSP